MLTKRSKIILSCLVTMLFMVSLLLGCTLFKSDGATKLTLAFDGDIYLTEGEVKEISYVCNYEDATVVFAISDNEVATVLGNKVIAKSSGTTQLRATATYKNQSAYSSCNVIASPKPEPVYTSEIEILSGGDLIGETIYSTGSTDFNLKIMKNGEECSAHPTISASAGITITKSFEKYNMQVLASGNLTIFVEELNIYFEYKIELKN